MENCRRDASNIANFNEEIITMLDKIEFSYPPMKAQGSLKYNNAASDLVDYSANSLPRALNISFEMKHAKLEQFFHRNKSTTDLRKNISQLYGFARSADGLIKDAYRERIWPILAEHVPRSTHLNAKSKCSSSRGSKSSRQPKNSCNFSTADEALLNDVGSNTSDSDFESALSTFSVSSDNEPMDNMGDDKVTEPSLEDLCSYKEWNQVELDVNRTLARFPPNISDTERSSLQKDLTPLIVRVLWENPKFSYYQGFHDVCLTLVLATNVSTALRIARLLTKRASFYNYLTTSLEASVMNELESLYVLLYMHDAEVERYLRDAELGTLFALSWPITWFSHDLAHYSQIVVFFDFFLSSHPLMPIYVGVALIAERRDEIFQCEQEMPYLHKLLNLLPENLNINKILDTARMLFERYPPSLVQGEFRREYNKICVRHRRKKIAIAKLQQRSDEIALARKVSRIPRYQALTSPWLVVGTASAAAICLWISKNYLECDQHNHLSTK